MRIFYTLTLLLTCIFRMQSAESNPALSGYYEYRDALVDAYQQVVDVAQRSYDNEKNKLTAAAIQSLINIAKRESRKPDKSVAIAAWKEVARLDITHAEANAFFTALGQWDAVRDKIEEEERSGGAKDLLSDDAILPAPIQEVLQKRTAGLVKARAAFAKNEDSARQKFRSYEKKKAEKTIKEIISKAKRAERSGELPEATLAYKAVLLIDPADETARAYFKGLNQLDAVLAELPEAKDVLGDPPNPDKGFAPVSLRGVKIVMTVSNNAEKRTVFEQLVKEYCTNAGMVITEVDPKQLGGDDGSSFLKDQQLLMLLGGLGDSNRGSLIKHVRKANIPIMITDVKMAEISGLFKDVDNSHRLSYAARLMIKKAGHPLAGGLQGEVIVLTPKPQTGPVEAVPIEKDPDLLGIYAPEIDLFDEAILSVGLTEERSTYTFALDTGAQIIIGKSKEGESVKAPIPARRLCQWSIKINEGQSDRLTREFWRLVEGNITWLLRGKIVPEQ